MSILTVGACDKVLGEESHGRKCGIESEGSAKVNGIGDSEQKNEHVQNISDGAPQLCLRAEQKQNAAKK